MNDEQNEIWNNIKDDLALPLEIDYSKLENQLNQFINWRNNKGLGFLEAVTGYGKTFVAIIAIKRMNLNRPNYNTIVIVPNTSLLNDWIDPNQGYIVSHNLLNVRVYVVNTFTMSDVDRNSHLLVLDEGHRYSNEESKFFSTVLDSTNFIYCLILSGSLEDEQKEFLIKRSINQIGEVTQQEAEYNGWVSKFKMYNIPITLDEEHLEKLSKIDDTINNTFKKFNFNFGLAMACSKGKNVPSWVTYKKGERGKKMTSYEWRSYHARQCGWRGEENHTWHPKKIQQYAGLWQKMLQERQKLLFNYYEKITLAKDILEKLNEQSIVFSESIEFVKALKSILPESEEYHSKLPTYIYKTNKQKEVVAESCDIKGKYRYKDGRALTRQQIRALHPNMKLVSGKKRQELIKQQFKEGMFKYLLTVHALDEGYNNKNVVVGLTASAKSTKRVRVQRDGRIIRKSGDKLAILINLYCAGTQEEKWLASRQRGIPKSKIETVTDINEITKELKYDETEIKIEE